MSLQEIVNVSISRDTLAVSQDGFGTLLILGTNLTSSNLVETVTAADAALAAMLTGGTAAAEYIAAAEAFSQAVPPTRVKIGKRGVGVNHTDALNAIILVDNDWYGFCTTSRTKAEQVECAAWAESKTKILSLATAESAVASTTNAADSTSLAAILKAANYSRTVLTYLTSSASQYPDVTLLATILPMDPGTYTAKFKSFSGITVDSLTATQSTNVRDKNANTYETVGGSPMFAEGKVCSGEFIDIIIFIDWLKSNITTEVFGLFKNAKKIPYTIQGMAAIKSQIDSVLQVGQNRGAISPYLQDENKIQNGGFITTLPDFNSITKNSRASRVLSDVKFTAWLSGAIHATQISGVVTV